MPKVLDLDGLAVVIHTNDHRPPHVHVKGAGRELVLYLHCPDGPPELRDNYGFAYRDIKRIIEALAQVLPMLCQEWEKLHGPY